MGTSSRANFGGIRDGRSGRLRWYFWGTINAKPTQTSARDSASEGTSMGLNCSHNAFQGAYPAFNRLRQCVCEAMGDGSSYPPHYIRDSDGSIESGVPIPRKEGLSNEWFYVGDSYSKETHPGLYEFLSHSDCDGEISPEMCTKVANELEALIPAVESLNWIAVGHIARDGGYAEVLRRFISGCREAANKGESLRFE
jgi:hypothetical protein